MDKILSQEEVDALLKGLSDGEIETSDAAKTTYDDSGIRPYDLTAQDRIIRGRMPTLEIINERFARLYRVSISSALRRVVDVSATTTEMLKFGEFLKTLPVPTSLHIIKMDPLRGHILLVIESRLIFNLLDCFFGGTGRSRFKIEGRDFTSVENRVILRLVYSVITELENAWRPVVPVQFQYVRSEVNPQFAAIVPPSDLVIVIHFEFELDQSIGKMILCLPYSTIEPIRQRLHASYQSDQLEIDETWIRRLKKRISEISVQVVAELGRTQIRSKDLLNLEKGDILVLNQDVGKPIVIRVQGVKKFLGIPGTYHGSKAIKITDLIYPEAE
ncbi:MAG: flagellar motor switch protein FliM [Syntrophobacterales bacterium]|nr:flagellar motor switch protein FliM [Syntrophobacterales bacterium]